MLNLNIEKDDHSVNHFIICWSLFKEIPCKINLYNNYNSELFIEFIQSYEVKEIHKITDVFPTTSENLVNERILVKISDDIYLSYVNSDKLTENRIISDVSIFYRSKSDENVQKIVQKIEEFATEIFNEDIENKINSVILNGGSFDLESFEPINADYENIELYFTDEVFKKINKLIKKLKNSNKGLSIIVGRRGTGKTTIGNYISSSLDKSVIFLPFILIESIVNNLDFREFLKRYKNSILVIDDCEIWTKNPMFGCNILQLIDGFQSDSMMINILLIINGDKSDIDSDLLDCNNLHSLIEIGELDEKKSIELTNHLGVNFRGSGILKRILGVNSLEKKKLGF